MKSTSVCIDDRARLRLSTAYRLRLATFRLPPVASPHTSGVRSYRSSLHACIVCSLTPCRLPLEYPLVPLLFLPCRSTPFHGRSKSGRCSVIATTTSARHCVDHRPLPQPLLLPAAPTCPVPPGCLHLIIAIFSFSAASDSACVHHSPITVHPFPFGQACIWEHESAVQPIHCDAILLLLILRSFVPSCTLDLNLPLLR